MSRWRIPRRLGPFLFLLLLLALPLAWLLRDFVAARLVAPLAYFFWQAGPVARSLPQEELWAFFLLFVIAYSFWLLARRFRVPDAPAVIPRPGGPVATWLEALQLAGQGGFAGKMLLVKMRTLVVDAFTHREQQAARETWLRLRSRKLPLPPELATYLQGKPSPGAGRETMQLEEIVALAKYLEDYLEESHEH